MMEEGIRLQIENLERGLRNAKDKNGKLHAEIVSLRAMNKLMEQKIIALTKQIPAAKKKMCGKKKSYPNKASALKTVEFFGTGRVYECPICFCWHISNTESLAEQSKKLEAQND